MAHQILRSPQPGLFASQGKLNGLLEKNNVDSLESTALFHKGLSAGGPFSPYKKGAGNALQTPLWSDSVNE